MLDRLTVKPSCYTNYGKEGVDLFYARILFAMSDVIVFVMAEDGTLREELIHVLEWASQSIHTTVNSPRKTLIMVRNMSLQHRPELYNENLLREDYLNRSGRCCDAGESAILKDFVMDHNKKIPEYDRRLQDNDQLYRVLFRDVVCCYIPNDSNKELGGRTAEAFRQYVRLRKHTENAAVQGIESRRASYSLYGVPMVQKLHRRTFRHFSSAKIPFDLHTATRRDNPNPGTFQAHLANFLRHALDSRHDPSVAAEINGLIKATITVSLLTYSTRHHWERK
jgi:hypothetical protein